MNFFASFLFGLTASLDSLLFGISYGIRRKELLIWENLLISGITLIGTVLSVFFGSLLHPIFPQFAAKTVGCLALIFMGLFYLKKGSGSPKKSELPKISTSKELMFTGIVLSLNNFGMGLGAGIAGLLFLPTVIFTFLFSVLFLYLGNQASLPLDSCLAKEVFCENYADTISGLLMILLGLLQILL